MSGEMQTPIDRPYGQTPEGRAKAIANCAGEPDAELLMQALGLVEDPIAAAKTRAKAIAGLNVKASKDPGPAPPGACPYCRNKVPVTGVCRRGRACRDAALVDVLDEPDINIEDRHAIARVVTRGVS